MARTRRRLFSPSAPAMVASGKNIDLKSGAILQAVLSWRQKWQAQAWETYDTVGEVKYGINILASLVSRVQYFVAELPENKDAKPQRTENTTAIETFERLGNIVTLADLIRELAINLLVPGECYLVAFGARDEQQNKRGDLVRDEHGEVWEIRSTDEVKVENNIFHVVDIELSGGVQKWIKLDQEDDTAIRIWRQHARKHHLADSHVRAILDAAEELLWWDAAARGRAKSRLSDTGVVEIPMDMETPPMADDDPALTGAERTAKRILEAAMEPISNPGSSASVAPIVVTYPANDQRKSGLNHLKIDRPQDELIEKRTDRALSRIERGLNLPVGVVSGLGTATHWGGGQIEESTFREHVEPLVMLIISALTTSFLHPILREEGLDPEKYVIWYDNSNLITHQDKAANSLRALELGAIGWPALRRELGYSESDAPEDDEREEIREWLQSIRSSQKQGIVEDPSDPNQPGDDPNAPPGKPPPPGKKTAPTEQRAAPLKRKGQSPVAASAYTNGLSTLVASVQAMADEKVRRAQEKAGNRLRSRARKVPAYSAAIRGVRSEDVARTLGREAVINLGINDLFDGCFDNLTDRLTYFTSSHDTFSPRLTASVAAPFLAKKLHEISSEVLFSEPSMHFLVPSSIVEQALDLARQEATDAVQA